MGKHQLFASWLTFNAFVICWLFSKFPFKKKIFPEHYRSVKWFGSRSGPTFCRSWSGSKLFAKVISRWQEAAKRKEQRHIKFETLITLIYQQIYLNKHCKPCILSFVFEETPRCVLWQTVKTQMKCSMMLHFIRVYTVCIGKKDLQTKYNFFFHL